MNPIIADPYALNPPSPLAAACAIAPNANKLDYELDQYISTQFDVQYDSPLDFWKQKIYSDAFPTLARFSRKVFAVQASSAPSERVVSLINDEMPPDRGNMKPDTLSNLVYTVSLEQFEKHVS